MSFESWGSSENIEENKNQPEKKESFSFLDRLLGKSEEKKTRETKEAVDRWREKILLSVNEREMESTENPAYQAKKRALAEIIFQHPDFFEMPESRRASLLAESQNKYLAEYQKDPQKMANFRDLTTSERHHYFFYLLTNNLDNLRKSGIKTAKDQKGQLIKAQRLFEGYITKKEKIAFEKTSEYKNIETKTEAIWPKSIEDFNTKQKKEAEKKQSEKKAKEAKEEAEAKKKANQPKSMTAFFQEFALKNPFFAAIGAWFMSTSELGRDVLNKLGSLLGFANLDLEDLTEGLGVDAEGDKKAKEEKETKKQSQETKEAEKESKPTSEATTAAEKTDHWEKATELLTTAKIPLDMEFNEQIKTPYTSAELQNLENTLPLIQTLRRAAASFPQISTAYTFRRGDAALLADLLKSTSDQAEKQKQVISLATNYLGQTGAPSFRGFFDYLRTRRPRA